MHTWQENRSIKFTECAIFRIPTARHGDVYMRAERSNYNAEKYAVVEVDAERFLALWRQPHSSHEDVAHGTPETWPSDRKYKGAAGGFTHGAENPVPLAEVGCGYDTSETLEVRQRFFLFKKEVTIAPSGLPWLGFTNGVTRTIWLLTQGAAVFPVKCSIDEAAELQKLAGLPGGRPVRLSDLIPEKPRYCTEHHYDT